MMKIFNTNQELSIRALLVLYTYQKPLSSDGIASLDLLITYGKQFDFYKYNLHGDNSLSFCEICSRKIEVKDAIHHLVINNFITVFSNKDGLYYQINDKGRNICKNLESEYALEYLKIAEDITGYLKYNTENEIIKYVINCSVKGGM